MMYELWDVDIDNCLARYAAEREMATLVRALVSRHGPSAADDLSLTVEDEQGSVLDTLDGERLIEWVETVGRRERNPARIKKSS
jgi:hypothetical protein